jgi:hypothetical protein
MSQAYRTKTDARLLGLPLLFIMVVMGILLAQRAKAAAVMSGVERTAAFLADTSDESVLGVFEGTTPCSGQNPPLPHIPLGTDCEQMIWKLTLYQAAATGQPTTYELAVSYGLAQQGTTGLGANATELNLEGPWAIQTGTAANPDTQVYQLNPDDAKNSIQFVKLGDNLLHVLTPDRNLMVGNAAWSYTLNRTDRHIMSDLSEKASPFTPETVAELPTQEAATPAVFEGRIPCIELILALHDFAASACNRVKIRLILGHDADTGAPATFELLNIYVGGDDTRYQAFGTWAILQGTPSDPQALVYQLAPEDAQEPISLFRADDNHLYLLDSDFNFVVGDAIMSYTLTRAEDSGHGDRP